MEDVGKTSPVKKKKKKVEFLPMFYSQNSQEHFSGGQDATTTRADGEMIDERLGPSQIKITGSLIY